MPLFAKLPFKKDVIMPVRWPLDTLENALLLLDFNF